MNSAKMIANAACLGLAALLSVGCMAEFGEGDMEEIGQSGAPLVNGTNTTGYAPVVRIQNSSGGLCTATAIRDDLLITASHCIKSGNDVRDWVKVRIAHGANSDAQGAYSSYFMLSEDIYDNYYVETSNGPAYYKRDFAFIKFGEGTFSSTYSTGTVTSSITGDTVRMLGFGGNDTKAYGDDTVTYTSSRSGNYTYITTDQNSGPNTENGDSGGPLLRWTGSEYELIGVLYGSGVFPVINGNLDAYIMTVIDNDLNDRCVEVHEHSSYGGDSWSFCNRTSINNKLNSYGFSDPYKIDSHWNYSDWNDEITGIRIPSSNTIITVFEHSSQGGDSLTLQSVLPFGNGTAISSLGDYGFNDKISSFTIARTSSGTNKDWYIEITRHDKCLDVKSNGSSNGTNIQQYGCNSTDAQIFRVEPVGSYYQIKHVSSGKCLDVDGNGSSNGTNVQLWTCNEGDAQLFTLTSNGSTSDVRDFKIKGKGSGKCLDLSAGGSSNGTNMQIWSCSSTNTNQNFALNRAY